MDRKQLEAKFDLFKIFHEFQKAEKNEAEAIEQRMAGLSVQELAELGLGLVDDLEPRLERLAGLDRRTTLVVLGTEDHGGVNGYEVTFALGGSSILSVTKFSPDISSHEGTSYVVDFAGGTAERVVDDLAGTGIAEPPFIFHPESDRGVFQTYLGADNPAGISPVQMYDVQRRVQELLSGQNTVALIESACMDEPIARPE